MAYMIDGEDISIAVNAVTANGALSPDVPAGYAIDAIYIRNTTANAVTGGVNFGTTSLASDIALAFAVGANGFVAIPAASILKLVFSATAAQTLFISAVTAFNSASLNVVVRLKRAIP